MGSFSHHSGQPQLITAATGLAWTSPAPALRVVSLGTPRERVVSVGTLAELAYAKNVVVYTVKFSNIKMDVISVAGPLWARGRLVLLAKS